MAKFTPKVGPKTSGTIGGGLLGAFLAMVDGENSYLTDDEYSEKVATSAVTGAGLGFGAGALQQIARKLPLVKNFASKIPMLRVLVGAIQAVEDIQNNIPLLETSFRAVGQVATLGFGTPEEFSQEYLRD
jgi:hypothetical protein